MYSADIVSVREILSDPYHFQLPRFQRQYGWKTQFAARLLKRIAAYHERDNVQGDDNGYFLGAFIFIPAYGVAKPGRRLFRRERGQVYDLIDGQQRLATLLIILCLIRDSLPRAKARWLNGFITGSGSDSLESRFVMRGENEEVFRKFVKESGATQRVPDPDTDTILSGTAPEAILSNRETLRDILVSLGDEDELVSIANYILDRCHLLAMEADLHDDAHQIYEALNFSGMPLSTANHIKSIAFRNVPDSDPRLSDLADKWDAWEQHLGAIDFDRLLAMVRNIEGDPNTSVVEANARIVERVGGGIRYTNEIIAPVMNVYERLMRANKPGSDEDPQIRRPLVHLNWLGNTDWIGPAIKWLQNGPQNRDATVDFLQRLDRLMYGLMIANTSGKARVARARGVTDAITATSDPALITALSLSTDEQNRALFRLSNDYQKSAGRHCKLVLMRLWDELNDTLTPEVPEGLSIEHLLPRTVSLRSPWNDSFADPNERIQCFKRLSNMVLIPIRMNRKITNKVFEFKKQVIADDLERRTSSQPDGAVAPFYPLTNYLLTQDTWDSAAINAREDELIAVIRRIWDFKGPAGRELDKT